MNFLASVSTHGAGKEDGRKAHFNTFDTSCYVLHCGREETREEKIRTDIGQILGENTYII
jgi:hypothetical protein